MGAEVHDSDSADHAVHLVRRTALAESIATQDIKPSYSRPRVSDDNACAESLFRTAKYRPEFPIKGFASLDEARVWTAGFVHWYNVEHRHSGIGYVSPQQRHVGADRAILAARHALYEQARQRHPERWSGSARNWSHISVVALNPEREAVVKRNVSDQHIQQRAAWLRRQPP